MSVEEVVDRPVPPGARLVWVGRDAQRTEGWFFPARGSSERPAPAVLFLHGNNELIDHCLEYAETYPRLGVSVLLAEYRGFGRSTGLPGRDVVREDMKAFFDWLATQPEVDPERIVFHGRSIGGAVAADLAQHREPAAMVLVATFTSMSALAWRYAIPGPLVRDAYDTAGALVDLSIPVLVMHGARDDIIPVSQGRELGALGAATTYVEYDANHDLPTEWEPFETELETFLRSTVLSDRP